MACPKCGCKVSYQYDDQAEDVCGTSDERMDRCAACGAVFDIEDHAPEDDEQLIGDASDGCGQPVGNDDEEA